MAPKHLLLWESTRQTAERFAGAPLKPTEPKLGRYDMIVLIFSSNPVVFQGVSMHLWWGVIWRLSAPGWVLEEGKCSVNEIKTMFTERRHPFQRNSHGPDRLQIRFHVSSRAGWWHLPTLFTQTGEWDFLTSIKAVARKQICSLLKYTNTVFPFKMQQSSAPTFRELSWRWVTEDAGGGTVCIWGTALRAQRHGRIEVQVWGRPSRASGAFPRTKDTCAVSPGGQLHLHPAANQRNTNGKAQINNSLHVTTRRLLGWDINESFWSFSSAFWESKVIVSSPPQPSPPLPSLPSPPLPSLPSCWTCCFML